MWWIVVYVVCGAKFIILSAFLCRIDILSLACKTPGYTNIIHMRLGYSKVNRS